VVDASSINSFKIASLLIALIAKIQTQMVFYGSLPLNPTSLTCGLTADEATHGKEILDVPVYDCFIMNINACSVFYSVCKFH